MNTVKIVPTKKSGKLVTPYESNGDYGYVQLQESSSIIDSGWLRTVNTSALLRGKIEDLENLVNSVKPHYTLSGKLVVSEFVESKTPENVLTRNINKDLTREDAIQNFIKKTSEDGIELTVGGERILRFTEYDPTGAGVSTRVEHDNQKEVAEWTKMKSEEAAKFPKS